MKIMKPTLAGMGVAALAAVGYYAYRWFTDRPQIDLGDDDDPPRSDDCPPETPPGSASIDDVDALIENLVAKARGRAAEQEQVALHEFALSATPDASAAQ